jgi:RimJ/RimL family protein N-acetyltransferase
MIWSGDIRHGGLIARAARTGFDPDVDKCVSRLDRNGNFIGGFILTNFTGASIMVHMAGVGGHWCSPLLMWVLFDYCFEQLGVKKVLCTVGSSNIASLQQVQRAGFTHEYTIEDAIPDGDLILFSMLRQNCRWLNLRKRFLQVNGHRRGEDVYA